MDTTVDTTDPTTRPNAASLRETLPRFAMIMATLLALAAFPQSAFFTVERIEVRGAGMIPAAEVVELSGLKRAERLFAVDAAAALRRLRADPRIREAAVLVRPPRIVSIKITERRPMAALITGAGFAMVADDHVVVAITPDSGGLPEIEDRTRPDAEARPGHSAASEGVRAALEALDVVQARLAVDLKRIVVAKGPDLTLITRSGLEIRAGGLLGLSERLGQVPRVLDALRAKGLTPASLDLRYGGSVVVRPYGAGDGR
ncbi:MAG: FtsQ-type POTRA domain-containing protein [Armatimonadetes bacterium]|nr:FtsQ-type POTRA domain-containing protein [Armatimonadota bacterium]